MCGDWEPDWRDNEEKKYSSMYSYDENKFYTYYNYSYNYYGQLTFKEEESAKDFIETYKEDLMLVMGIK